MAALAAWLPGIRASAQDSAAARWNALLLQSIRLDYARPPVHARNLFHHSAGMWDAWLAFGGRGKPALVAEHGSPGAMSVDAAREQAIAVFSYRFLTWRFDGSPGKATMLPQYRALLAQYGVLPTDTHVAGDDPVAVGNRIATALLEGTYYDGANEEGNYANLVYAPVNPPLLVSAGGNPSMPWTSRWQSLALSSYVDQQGNVIPSGYPPFLAAEWGRVQPFGLQASDRTMHPRDGANWPVWMDPGAPPQYMGLGNASLRAGNELVLRWSGHLDPSDGVMWDISPGTMGASPEPTDPANWQPYYDAAEGRPLGTGRAVNPRTGLPYAPNLVPRGDFTRVLAEFWADGPTSETPPGHWFALLNDAKARMASHRIGGRGTDLGALEWDVRAYLLLGGTMHDAAVSAWSIKGAYDAPRPISLIRYMAQRGQSSDPTVTSFNVTGIGLVPGSIELITEQSAAPGQRHAGLASEIGKVAVRTWRGPGVIGNPIEDTAGVGWILGRNWHPYQRPTFVTPPFAGWVSGHSTYSRAAAEVLTLLTGDAYFPGGMAQYRCAATEFLVFEDGPSVDVTLQWATYRDAAEQSCLSRIWGGIHPPFDDMAGRSVGRRVAARAWARAQELWDLPPACAADLDGDGRCDGADLALLLAAWGPVDDRPAADLNADGIVDGADLGLLLSSWGACQ